MTGKNIGKGMVAGLIATIVLSGLMLMKQKMGLMPQLNPIEMLTTMAGASTPVVGWGLHFFIGTVMWGFLFAWLDHYMPGGNHWLKGVAFGTGAWLLMMVMVMPMAGAGFFGMSLGMMAPVMTLVFHFVYGAVLGGVYGLQHPETAQQPQLSHR